MSFDTTPQSLEQCVSALLATPEPLKAWLRTQPPDDSAGDCGDNEACVLSRFIGCNLIEAGRLEPWGERLVEWFDRQNSRWRPGPTHAEVLQHLESA